MTRYVALAMSPASVAPSKQNPAVPSNDYRKRFSGNQTFHSHREAEAIVVDRGQRRPQTAPVLIGRHGPELRPALIVPFHHRRVSRPSLPPLHNQSSLQTL